MNFIFRNSMLEIFFPKHKYVLSDYDSPLSSVQADNFIWINFIKPSPTLNEILKQFEELENNLLTSIKTSNSKPIYVLGLFMPKLYTSPLLNDLSISDQINKFNQKIIHLSEEHDNISYLEPNHLLSYIGPNYFSSKFYFSSSSIISPQCASSFCLWLSDLEFKISHARKKLLILDLDNTLWGGVLGEDGFNGIQIGNTYPGNTFLYMQKKVKELSDQGVILAACSKNNFDDVLEGFEKNQNMHLKIEDFSLIKANWNDKTKNIEEIISEINVGEDACVFLDDNPLERDMVRNSFPDIITPEFPIKEYEIPEFIDNIGSKYFSIKSLTNEDKNKKNQYKIKLQAERDKLQSSNKSEFLRDLKIEGLVHTEINSHILRISQMTKKTNQFNLTTDRLDEHEVKEKVDSGNYIFPLQIKDKYGDHGITALIIVEKSKSVNHVTISNFLMSCRILGRDIEYEFLRWCLMYLLEKGIKTVSASYIKTKKNNQVKKLYENAGFQLVNKHNGNKLYKIVLEEWINAQNITENYMKIKQI